MTKTVTFNVVKIDETEFWPAPYNEYGTIHGVYFYDPLAVEATDRVKSVFIHFLYAVSDERMPDEVEGEFSQMLRDWYSNGAPVTWDGHIWSNVHCGTVNWKGERLSGCGKHVAVYGLNETQGGYCNECLCIDGYRAPIPPTINSHDFDYDPEDEDPIEIAKEYFQGNWPY